MDIPQYRRRLKPLLLGSFFVNPVSLSIAQSREPSQVRILAENVSVSTVYDFAFLVGSWVVQHRRLKNRLAHSDEWETFSATSVTTTLLGGQVNIDDNVVNVPAERFRAVTLRSFAPVTRSWSIWWLDSRHPHQLDTPVVGGFHITSTTARWQQAFSEDGGATWETKWIMEFRRASSPRVSK